MSWLSMEATSTSVDGSRMSTVVKRNTARACSGLPLASEGDPVLANSSRMAAICGSTGMLVLHADAPICPHSLTRLTSPPHAGSAAVPRAGPVRRRAPGVDVTAVRAEQPGRADEADDGQDHEDDDHGHRPRRPLALLVRLMVRKERCRSAALTMTV